MKTAFTIVLLSIAVATGMAHPGVGLVEDSQGNIFYTDLSKVWKMTLDGHKSVVVPDVHTHELFIDENDNLFGEHLWYNGEATNTWGHFAWKYTKDGKFQKVVPDSDGFLTDYSFVRDHFGRMYWADRSDKCQHVVRMNNDHSKTTLGDECMVDIRWMTSSKNGMLYVVDKHDLKKIDTQGKVTTVARSIPERKLSQFTTPEQHFLAGISVDKSNNVYVCDVSGRKVNKFDRDGKMSVVYESPLLWGPTAFLLAADGRQVVLETSMTNEVRVVMVDGQ
jgi:hypothetical protein